MAAKEYYYGTAGAQQMQHQNRPQPYPPQQPQYPYQQQPPQPDQPYPHTPPPSYSPFPPQQQQQVQSYSPQPQYQHQPQAYPSQPQGYPSNAGPPYPQTPHSGPQKYPSERPPPQNEHLGVPFQPQRSHSQPPRVRFADKDEYADDSESTTDRSYTSESDSPRRRHRRRKHRHSHSGSRDHDRDHDRDLERSRHRGSQRADHKDRDTFLGAGAGGLVGDLIFPGLGTAAGLLLGGYGGRKHGKRRSRSQDLEDRESHHGRRGAGSGWDEASATYKKGTTVR
ncbi:hypothetical protein BU26DRAFT_117259 [Trematosphaeria pertusa]|uniref:Uncharacterized protein n=1 Tax=Trematosphaeria pertusa TaxID=390896 RepID=A0A6A6HYW3_9PLEO|nr:uncharacterized protein BU26DRAFT_117259 [Trematosphaeria pertusa]KAF2243405.1 hypothetical protein BU26DRAFT_117259 [Trematosphaeria pertusa]